MKLSEIKLFEEPIPIKAAEELWQEYGNGSAQYFTSTIYLIKPMEDRKDTFEVFYDEDNKRKKYGNLNKADLNAAFVQLHKNDKPDVEGFLQYRSADLFSAFKYAGDPVKVQLSGEGDETKPSSSEIVKLNRGDYLLRQDAENDFIYTVERSAFFDNEFMKK